MFTRSLGRNDFLEECAMICLKHTCTNTHFSIFNAKLHVNKVLHALGKTCSFETEATTLNQIQRQMQQDFSQGLAGI